MCSMRQETDPSPSIRINRLCKDYAQRVLDDVDLDLAPGEIHALLGANGAGKSTLCGILAGLTQATSGEMELGGESYRPRDKSDAEDRGVQIVQQHLNLIPTLSVGENIFLRNLPNRRGWIERDRLTRDATEALRRVKLEHLDPARIVGELGVGTQQLIEIASALVSDCRLLILDEPTAALTDSEAQTLFERVRELSAAGVTVLYVSHRLDEIRLLCDRWTVLRDGRLIESGDMSEVTNRRIVELMAGEDATEVAALSSSRTDEPLLIVEGLSRGDQVRNVEFKLRRGERLGIAGLVGSGRSELLRTLFGADRASGGRLTLCGESLEPFSHPRDAVAHGLVMVTEDRKTDGLLLDRSISVNVTLARIPNRGGIIDLGAERERAAARCEAMDTRYRNIDQSVAELSGGNQQKVVLGRWLEVDADVYLLDEPTRGIDVAARSQIHRLLEALSEQGKGVIIVSSDLDELMSVCDTILAYANGGVVARFDRSTWSREALVEAAFAEHPLAARRGAVEA
jgi:ribose transport system ATP-binding protein